MKRKDFMYSKDGVSTKREVLILNERDSSFEGIDLTKLDNDERKKVLEIMEKYQAELQPFVTKAYRRFSKDLIS